MERDLRAAEERPSAAAREGRPGGRDSRPTILVVDDNKVNRQVAAAQLGRLGCDVDVAANGREALDVLREKSYDLVLMDCAMPEMDGYAATRAIRAREGGGRRLPIVALTANAVRGAREACLAAGMDDYLAKPVGTEDLRRMLARWLSGAEEDAAGPPTEAREAESSGGNGRGPSLDPHALAGIRALEATGEPGLVREILSAFLDSVTKRLPALREAAERADWPALERAAHSLRGSCGVVGAVRMAEPCAALERAAKAADPEAWRPALQALEEDWRSVRAELAAQLAPAAGAVAPAS